jgi:hypothetical protein
VLYKLFLIIFSHNMCIYLLLFSKKIYLEVSRSCEGFGI